MGEMANNVAGFGGQPTTKAAWNLENVDTRQGFFEDCRVNQSQSLIPKTTEPHSQELARLAKIVPVPRFPEMR